MNPLYVKATLYMEAGDLVRAEKWYKKLFKEEADHPEGCLNYGAMLKNRGDLRGALKYFKLAHSANPNWAPPLNNIGLVYHNLNQELTAEPYFLRAIALDSDYSDAHWNLALSLLKRGFSYGDRSLLDRGWFHYSHRFSKSGPVTLACKPSLPIYVSGSPGRCLVVAEQGFGDAIMFSRYLTSNMTVYTDGRFSDLFDAIGVPWTSSLEGFDTWIPMMSLAAGKDIPTVGGSWSSGEGLGVCWAGNKEHANDANRSRTDRDFAWLGEVKSFQFGVSSAIFGECVTNSWNDTVRELLKLRAFITVDTSVAHLAGHLGVPTCILVPSIDTDFRWGLGTNSSLLYPSVFVARNMQEVKQYVSNLSS